MSTAIIPEGSGTGTSSDITLADGASITVGIRSYTSTATALIEIKADDSSYVTVGTLTFSEPIKSIKGPGVFRVSRSRGKLAAFTA